MTDAVNAFTERLPHEPGAFEVAVKDTIWMKGLRATRGSRAFADFICPEDAVAVRRLRAAGAASSAAPPTRSCASAVSPSPSCTASHATRSTSRGSRAAPAAGQGPRSPPAPCRWRSVPTAVVPYVFRRRSAAWSATSRRSDWSR